MRAVGEERAWGRRLAKRFDVEGEYDEKTFVVEPDGQEGFIDYESSEAGGASTRPQRELFAEVPGRGRRR